MKLQGDFGLFYISYVTAVSVGIILAYFVAAIAPSMVGAGGREGMVWEGLEGEGEGGREGGREGVG